jgi:N-acetylmuramoyl-L-alanine amidase
MKFGSTYQLIWFVVSFVLSSSLITSLTVTDVCAEGLFLQAKKVTRKDITIVLDPGHGGHHPGAIGPGDIKEKDIALSLVQAIKKRLSAHYIVVSTRTDDYWIDIEERTAIANHHAAYLFISIHTGGSFRHRASGLGTFYWSGEEFKGLRHPITTPEKWDAEEASIAWESIQERHLSKSRSLAVRVHKELIGRLNINDRGCRAAPLHVLAGADMPAILVEVGYVTNPAEEKQLSSPLFLDIIAEGLSKGITDFLQEELRD